MSQRICISKPMKIEWATVKDDLVWIGSNGKEWTNEKTGKVIHQNTLWVKTINANGKISNIIATTKTVAQINKRFLKFIGPSFNTRV